MSHYGGRKSMRGDAPDQDLHMRSRKRAKYDEYVQQHPWPPRYERDSSFGIGSSEDPYLYYSKGAPVDSTAGYGYDEYYRSGARHRSYSPLDGPRDSSEMHRSYGRFDKTYSDGHGWFSTGDGKDPAHHSSWYGTADESYSGREPRSYGSAALGSVDSYYRGGPVDERYSSSRSSFFGQSSTDVAMPYISRTSSNSAVVPSRASSYLGTRAIDKYSLGAGSGFYRSFSSSMYDYGVVRGDEMRAARNPYSYYPKEGGGMYAGGNESYSSSYPFYRRFTSTPYYSGNRSNFGSAAALNGTSRYSTFQNSIRSGVKGGFGRYANNFKSKMFGTSGVKHAGKASLIHRSPTKSKKKDNSSGKIQKVEHKKLTVIDDQEVKQTLELQTLLIDYRVAAALVRLNILPDLDLRKEIEEKEKKRRDDEEKSREKAQHSFFPVEVETNLKDNSQRIESVKTSDINKIPTETTKVKSQDITAENNSSKIGTPAHTLISGDNMTKADKVLVKGKLPSGGHDEIIKSKVKSGKASKKDKSVDASSGSTEEHKGCKKTGTNPSETSLHAKQGKKDLDAPHGALKDPVMAKRGQNLRSNNPIDGGTTSSGDRRNLHSERSIPPRTSDVAATNRPVRTDTTDFSRVDHAHRTAVRSERMLDRAMGFDNTYDSRDSTGWYYEDKFSRDRYDDFPYSDRYSSQYDYAQNYNYENYHRDQSSAGQYASNYYNYYSHKEAGPVDSYVGPRDRGGADEPHIRRDSYERSFPPSRNEVLRSNNVVNCQEGRNDIERSRDPVPYGASTSRSRDFSGTATHFDRITERGDVGLVNGEQRQRPEAAISMRRKMEMQDTKEEGEELSENENEGEIAVNGHGIHSNLSHDRRGRGGRGFRSGRRGGRRGRGGLNIESTSLRTTR